MIPIRNFPYTDYHDLNLDYLLRQLQICEVDLEALKRRVKALEDWRTDTVDPDLINIKGDIVTIKGDIVDIRLDIIDLGNKIRLINNWMIDIILFVQINPNSETIYINGSGSNLTYNKILDAVSLSYSSSPIGYDPAIRVSKVVMRESSIERSVKQQIDRSNNIITFTSDYGDYYKVVTVTKTGEGVGEFTVNVTTEAKVQNNVIHLDTIHTNAADINAYIDGNDDPDTNTEYPYIWEYSDPNITADCIINAVFGNLKQNLDYSDNFSDYIKTSSGKITFYIKSAFYGTGNIDIDLYMVK